jgi:hypothetical protein
LKSKYYPEQIKRVIRFEKWRTLIDHASEMGYTGIAYSVRRLAQKGLLGGTVLAKPMHQDADTS